MLHYQYAGLLGGLGAPEILLILVIVLLMFGGKKIPELMKGLGQGVKEFKDASKTSETKDNTSAPTTTTSAPTEKK
jgi:sec-independent protein translocase protein TatA